MTESLVRDDPRWAVALLTGHVPTRGPIVRGECIQQRPAPVWHESFEEIPSTTIERRWRVQLSNESARARWLIMALAWLVVGGVIFTHTRLVREYLTIAGNLGIREGGIAPTPLKAAYPAFAADAQTWVRHALSLAEGDQSRLRFTTIDNGVVGREVHWNSAWGWTIVLAGKVEQRMTGGPLAPAIERSSVWLPSVVFGVLIVVFSGLTAQRAGAMAGVFMAIGMLGHPRVFEGFFPSYVDHHGLLAVSVLGVVLGAAFMGAGWWQADPGSGSGLLPRSVTQARQGAWISAISGAFGAWVSAASTLPPIAIVGCAGALTVLLAGRAARRAGAQFDAETWRLWGRVGAIASTGFYLVEYFPSHMGLRMESNHPFYALAWLGGGYLLGEWGELWLAPVGTLQRRWKRLVWPILAVVVAPATILIGGAKVFVVMDPFLANLHRSIQEFLPLWTSVRAAGWQTIWAVVGLENVPLFVALVSLFFFLRPRPLLLWFVAIATILFASMAWMQSRWLLNASGPHVVMALVLLTVFFGRRRTAVRWSAVAVALALLFSHAFYIRLGGAYADVNARRVAPKDAQQALFRDIAAALRASSPEGEIVLLSSPNSSTAIGYYGRFKTLGTLYWENGDGLKKAAAIHAAASQDIAGQLIREHRVTHVAMISEEPFIEQYFRLSRPEASMDEFKKCFGYQLLGERVVPTWLQMLPYKVPDDLAPLKVSVMLFKVAFEQSPADALYHIAISKIATGATEEAERDLDQLISQLPAAYQPWLRKGEIRFTRRDWEGSVAAMLKGIGLAPKPERLALYATAASSYYREKLPAQAVLLYRAALAETFDPNLAAYLAFALATSSDDTVRNGREAQEVAERALRLDPDNPVILNALAAAQAENGDFAKAVTTVERALGLARLKGDTALQQVSEQRVALFREQKPLRQ